MSSNDCPKCGAPVPGVFCTNCGASTAHTDVRARPSVSGRAFRLDAGDEAADQSLETETSQRAAFTVGADRSYLRRETTFVMIAFLLPIVVAAIILFAKHLSGVGGITRFPDIVSGHPVTNLILGILEFTSVLALVPLALLLLSRTGQTPAALGIEVPGLLSDWLPGLGLAVAAFCGEIVVLIPLAPLIAHHQALISKIPVGHVPAYYVVWGLAISAMTAITEEVMMSGYFLTRLEQLGWSPSKSLTLSLVLRTSYHVYYGVGFLLTIPFGFLVTRSFQKHRRLMRPIAAHFLFDGALLTLAILR